MSIIKIDDNTIEFTKTIPEETVVIPAKVEVNSYDFGFLTEQKVNVAKDLADIIAKQEQELADFVKRQADELEVAQANVTEVDLLLTECANLGIVAKDLSITKEVI